MSNMYVRPMDLHIHAPNGECEEMGCINISKLQRESTEVTRYKVVYEAAFDWIYDDWGDIKKTDELHVALNDAVDAASSSQEKSGE